MVYSILYNGNGGCSQLERVQVSMANHSLISRRTIEHTYASFSTGVIDFLSLLEKINDLEKTALMR